MTLFGQEHVDRYVATDGEEGHDWQGTQTLILTTTGRKSGEPRPQPLIYGRRGDAPSERGPRRDRGGVRHRLRWRADRG